MTFIAQYGYKTGISTIDSIAKIEHAIQAGPDSATIVLMDLSKAIGCVNRLILWTTIYKTELPIPAIRHIKLGRRNTTLRSKEPNDGRFHNGAQPSQSIVQMRK